MKPCQRGRQCPSFAESTCLSCSGINSNSTDKQLSSQKLHRIEPTSPLTPSLHLSPHRGGPPRQSQWGSFRAPARSKVPSENQDVERDESTQVPFLNPFGVPQIMPYSSFVSFVHNLHAPCGHTIDTYFEPPGLGPNARGSGSGAT